MLEMRNARPPLKVYEDNAKNLVGYQEAKYYYIFDVKLGECFRGKDRLVGGRTYYRSTPITYIQLCGIKGFSEDFVVGSSHKWIENIGL